MEYGYPDGLQRKYFWCLIASRGITLVFPGDHRVDCRMLLRTPGMAE